VDPNDVYTDQDLGILEATDLQVPPRALTEYERRRALVRVETHEDLCSETYLGHQNQADFFEVDFQGSLSKYLNTLLNNVGDPFVPGSLTKNTKFAERAVLDYFASLWNARWPSRREDPDSHWGYVLSMGSTEGNLYSILQGRDYLKGKPLYEGRQMEPDRRLAEDDAGADQTIDNPNAFRPIAFFSEDRHYSIFKALRAMEVPTYGDVGNAEYPGECPITDDGHWPFNVPSVAADDVHPVGRGEIDVDKLEKLVEFFAARGHPVLLVLTVGTTFKGAHDPVDTIGERLMPIFRRHGLAQRRVWSDPDKPEQYDWRTGFWMHIDGALGAAYLPFLEMAHSAGRVDKKGPVFDFRLPYVHSMVMSGHKWPGTPWPTGIYMTKRKYLMKPPEDPDYIGAPDTTFAGSRNGLSPLVFWWYTAVMSYDAQVERIVHCQRIAEYAERKLRELSRALNFDLWVQRTPLSLSILFRKPNDRIAAKYSLSTQYVPSPDHPTVLRNYAHIYCMGSVSEDLVERFIEELKAPDAFPDAEEGRSASRDKSETGIQLADSDNLVGTCCPGGERLNVNRLCA
jgi:histidine decarboxylase